MAIQASSTSIAPGETIDFSITIGGEGISAPTIIITLPDELSFAGYSANNEGLPFARPDTQTLVWYPVIAQIATNYPYPAVIDISVQMDSARDAIEKIVGKNGELVTEAAAYINGELLAVSLLTLESSLPEPEEITPTPTIPPTQTPFPVETLSLIHI